MGTLSMLLVLLSIFAILFTIYVLLLLFVKKLISKSKTADKKDSDDKKPVKSTSKSDEKISSLWIVPFAVFIVLLLGLIVAVLMTKHDIEEENMNKIISDTNTILESSRSRIDRVPLSELKEKQNSISTQINVMAKFGDNTGLTELKNKTNYYDTLVGETIRKVPEFQSWIEGVISQFPSKCGAKTDVDKDNINAHMDETNNIRFKLEQAINADNAIFFKMQQKLTATAKSQQNLDVGENKLENHINTMKAMLDHFGTDINKSEKTRQRWSDKMSSSLPTLSTHFIIKVLVPITCGVIIILCIVIIIVIIRPKFIGPKLLSLGKKVPIYTTGVVIIITSGIVIVACLGLVGAWTCSLRVGYFGLSNFTSPFSGNITVPICQTVDSKFFDGLGNDPLITSDSVRQSLKVNEYKQIMLDIVLGSSISIDVPVEFSQELSAIDKSLKKLDELFGRNCLNNSDQRILADYQQTLRKFLDGSKSYTDSIEVFNGNVAKTKSIVSPIIDECYRKVVKSFDVPINVTQGAITAFSCNPIIASYANTADSICKKFEVPLKAYWIILLLTLLLFVIIMIVQLMSIEDV